MEFADRYPVGFGNLTSSIICARKSIRKYAMPCGHFYFSQAAFEIFRFFAQSRAILFTVSICVFRKIIFIYYYVINGFFHKNR